MYFNFFYFSAKSINRGKKVHLRIIYSILLYALIFIQMRVAGSLPRSTSLFEGLGERLRIDTRVISAACRYLYVSSSFSMFFFFLLLVLSSLSVFCLVIEPRSHLFHINIDFFSQFFFFIKRILFQVIYNQSHFICTFLK